MNRLQEDSISVEPRINDRIRVPEVRLVGSEGEQIGIVPVGEALRMAQEADLDLVEVAPDARPPVCKLMDYGKFKYESA
ncbi:translation initiation factor IF-3, partial [Nakamurella sp.]|uniref:translation initiation factor IF-3 n=1 Tax=Nakamurella sp. TaxID=1869182 RepID=UPI003B3B614E